MIPFDFQSRTRIVFAPGSVARLGDIAGELGARRVLVVSDEGVISAGHTERGLEALRGSGIEAYLFDQVQENPTTKDVEAGVALARRYDPEMIVGFGGGSSMDCAKGINFILSNGGRMQDYWGVGKALKPMLPMIAVPTTAGTGAEMDSASMVTDTARRIKLCVQHPACTVTALADPQLTLSLPRHLTAYTGLDA